MLSRFFAHKEVRAQGATLVKLGTLFLSFLLSACEKETADQKDQKTMSSSSCASCVDLIDLPGWHEADLRPAAQAFLKSCTESKREKSTEMQQLCHKAQHLDLNDTSVFQAFLQDNFKAHPQDFARQKKGLATGYFQPYLSVSKTRSPNYPFPIYARPKDLIVIENLGQFNEKAKGIRIAGTLKNGTLVPYIKRQEIEAQFHLEGAEVLGYAADKLDLFFMHIQGSGFLIFDDGTTLQVAYDGTNGYPYTAIGRVMLEMNLLELDALSMEGLKTKLRTLNDTHQDQILQQNKSYVFFKPLQNVNAPIGAEGSQLTPQGSIAVDPDHIPLGSLVWVDAIHPTDKAKTLQTLTVAQDVGGAIKGANRADFFWGSGDAAGTLAGPMKSDLDLYVFVPKNSHD